MAEIVEKPQPFSVTARQALRRSLRNENAVLVIALIVISAITAIITKGKSISKINVQNVLSQISNRGVSSVGQLFVILTAGIDLSVGGVAALTMCLSSLPITGKVGLAATAMGIAVILLVGLGIGFVNGLLISRAGISPLIVTLSMWLITDALALQSLGKERLVTNLPPSLAFFGQANIVGVPVSFIIFAAVCASAYLVLNYTTFGRSIYAVGGNPVSAWLSGINTNNVRLFVYAISGFLAGFAGFLVLARVMTASVPVIGPLTFDTITAICIGGVSLFGGRGSVIGVVFGVVILGVISNTINLMMVPIAFQSIVKGALIVTAVTIYTIRRR